MFKVSMTIDKWQFQQQFELDEEQSQEGSVPLSIPLIIPAAQPTPDLTLMAPSGQFFSQAPHSMQRSRLSIKAFLSLIKKTSCGHTIVHILQPLHFATSSSRVTTFLRYTSPFISNKSCNYPSY